MPLLAGWVAFTFVYMALPNTRTRLCAPAALGGFVAGTAWQVALAAHVEFQVGVANYNKIYSTFAALPIFLVWVQVSWVIVLFGAELAFAHQHERDYRRVVGWRRATPAMRAASACGRWRASSRPSWRGAAAPTAEVLARELGVPAQPVEELLEALAAAGRRGVRRGADDDGTWLRRARPRARCAWPRCWRSLEGRRPRCALVARSGDDRVVDRLLAALDEERRGSAYNLSLRELAERGARARGGRDDRAGWAGPARSLPEESA